MATYENFIAVGYDRNTDRLRVLDTHQKHTHSLSIPNQEIQETNDYWIHGLAFSQNGSFLASSYDHRQFIYRVNG